MKKSRIAKEVMESRAPPEKVWELWEKAHLKNGQNKIEKGQKTYFKAEGKSQFRYEILEVVPKQRFSILWKTLFVRLIFTHEVKAIRKGSEICYEVEVKGLFAWPVRWMLAERIRQNIALVLKAIVKQLEQDI